MNVEKRNDIQWLRALAAIEVVFWHSDLITKHFSPDQIMQSIYQPLGGIGVEIFFIVSGYVICMRAPHYRSGLEFILSRVYRLFPLYWIFTGLVVLAQALNKSWALNAAALDAGYALKSLLVLPQYGYPILPLGWTLEHEMVFYAVVALAMLVPAGLRARSRLNVGMVLGLLGLAGLLLGTGPSGRLWDFHIASTFMLCFGAGWLLRRIDETGARAQRGTIAVFGLILPVAALLSEASEATLAYRFLLATGIFLGFWWFHRLFQADNRVNRWAATIGDASFSIYLSHWFVLSILGKVLGKVGMSHAVDDVVRVGGVVLCVLVGHLVFRTLEKPIDRFLRGGSKRSVRPVVLATPVASRGGSRS